MTVSAAHGRRRRHWVEWLIEVPAVIITFLMMCHITANALLRAFASSPLPNTLEIVQYLYLPVVAFLGFIAAQHRDQHITADLIFQMLPRAVRRYVMACILFLCAGLCAAFTWFVWGDAVHAMEIGKTAGVSDLVSWPAYFFAPLAFAVMTVQFLLAGVRGLARSGADRGAGAVDDRMFPDQAIADEVGRR